MEQSNAPFVPILPAPTLALPQPSRARGRLAIGGQQDCAPQRIYACQECTQRKIKCSKETPRCRACLASDRQCRYQQRSSRTRRRTQLASLQHQQPAPLRHQQPDAAQQSQPATLQHQQSATRPPNVTRQSSHSPTTASRGRLLVTHGQTRYIDSVMWHDYDDASLRETFDEAAEQSDHAPLLFLAEPVAASMVDKQQSASPSQHTTPEQAMALWTAYKESVQPLCKILHTPTTAALVGQWARNPDAVSRPHQCLLLAVCHAASLTLSTQDCLRVFGEASAPVVARYKAALFQALVNASWLTTTHLPVLQAVVLFLVAVRTQLDPHALWIMTGIAVRLAQRMGVHRDGQVLGLAPFDVEMKRRLWWQLIPLEGYAGQVSGTGISLSPDAWDTQRPSNVNDDKLWPAMECAAVEQSGATEMIFVLTRVELSNLYTRTGVVRRQVGASMELRGHDELERLIDDVEAAIESKFLRYCDVVVPLHFFTMIMARLALNSARVRKRMPCLMNNAMSHDERQALCNLAHRVLDSANTACEHPDLAGFRWQTRGFLVTESLLCILNSIAKVGFFTANELNMAWEKMARVYKNRSEFLHGRGALHVAIGRLTLRAWAANPSSNPCPAPAFIDQLRRIRKPRSSTKAQSPPLPPTLAVAEEGQVPPATNLDTRTSDANALLDSLNGVNIDLEADFSLATADWEFWDQLIRDCQHSVSDVFTADFSA